MIESMIVFFIRGYKFAISPMIGQNCRFSPTCSDYACESVIKHGAVYGGWLGIKRIIRCNPWSSGGYDPVP